MGAASERLERLRERIDLLVRQRDAAREAVESSRAETQRLEQELDAAQRHLETLDEQAARALADSFVGEGAEPRRTDRQGLEETRRRVWELQADRSQALRATELLGGELAATESRLEQGATKAKGEAAEGILEEARTAWRSVRALVDELRAIHAVEHGADPSIVERVASAAEDFERRLSNADTALEAPPPADTEAREPAARAAPLADARSSALRAVAVVLGAAGMIAGAFLEWLRPYGASGVDLEIRAFYERSFHESTASGRPSAGSVMVALGAVAVAGAFLRLRWLPPVAGALGIVGIVAYSAAVTASPDLRFPVDVGVGTWLTLAGGLLVVAQPFLRLRAAGVPEAPEPSPATGTVAPVTADRPAPAAGAPSPGEEADAHGLARIRTARRLRLARVVVGIVVLVLLALVVAENSQPVELKLLFATFEPRLIWVLLGAAVAGGVVGFALGRPGEYLRWRRGDRDAATSAAGEPNRWLTLAARTLVVAAVLIIVVVSAQNSQPVELKLLFATFEPRLIWVLLGAALAGGVVGFALGRPGEYLRRP